MLTGIGMVLARRNDTIMVPVPTGDQVV